MAVNLGNTPIANIYIGNTQIQNVYLGNSLIYSSFAPQTIIDNFKIRVANDGGTFEAESNLLAILNSVNSTIGLSKVNMLFTPNAQKASKGYNVIGLTDFAVLRNTDATRVNASGFLEFQGSNIMRIDYRSGTPMILDELQTTNTTLFSEDFANAAYTKGNVLVSSKTQINPRGASTSTALTETAVTSSKNIFSNDTFIGGQTYVQSIFVHKGLGSLAPDIVQLTFSTAVFGANQFANFNISTGVVTFSTGGTASIEAFANDWYKIKFSAICTASGATSTSQILLCNNNPSSLRAPSYLGNVNRDVLIFGANVTQLDSSYIPTTNAAVTRNDDLITVTPAAGTVRITTTFLDNSTQVLNTIPATFTLPQGQIRQVVFQNSL